MFIGFSMTPDLLQLILVNFPNFMGLVVLGIVLYMVIQALMQRMDDLIDVIERLIDCEREKTDQ